jgi:cytochrome c peroxidase
MKYNIPRKITTGFSIFIIPIAIYSFFSSPAKPYNKAEVYYLKALKKFKSSLVFFKSGAEKKQTRSGLQQLFYKSRIEYKKLAVLTDYFSQYETRILNGPAIPRMEQEMSDKIIPPQGFQAIEQLLFADWKAGSYPQLIFLINEMLSILSKLEKEPDLVYKFKDEQIWDAMRSSVVQMVTSLTGFDSPIANNSINEAKASFDGILAVLVLYKTDLEKDGGYASLLKLINKCRAYLQSNPNFIKFDRLSFISNYLNPFFKQLVRSRKKAGFGVPEGRSSINYSAESIFAKDALALNFYSPPEEYWVTEQRIMLGQQLFTDPILSDNKSRSCATCHQPSRGFSDGLAKPYAIDNKTILNRNTPTLWNAGYQTKQFYDSRVDILENQLGEVVHNVQEMQGSLNESVKELRNSGDYKKLFSEAYPNEKNPISTFTIANAISNYVRSLQSLNSRFDQYMNGDQKKLTTAEKNGFNLFAGKAKCATCHFIPLFNGVVPPFYAETESEVLGVPSSKSKTSAQLDTDLGKFHFTKSAIHKHAFKTPTLRNIALTAPYMHNGVFDTLEEVLDFYNEGGGAGLKIMPENQTLPPDKLNLTKKEMNDIISFMKALTDTSRLKTFWHFQ